MSYQKDTDNIQKIISKKDEQSDRKELDVDFELVSPSEPYFHIVRTLLT